MRIPRDFQTSKAYSLAFTQSFENLSIKYRPNCLAKLHTEENSLHVSRLSSITPKYFAVHVDDKDAIRSRWYCDVYFESIADKRLFRELYINEGLI